jgi:hypothetical protein
MSPETIWNHTKGVHQTINFIRTSSAGMLRNHLTSKSGNGKTILWTLQRYRLEIRSETDGSEAPGTTYLISEETTIDITIADENEGFFHFSVGGCNFDLDVCMGKDEERSSHLLPRQTPHPTEKVSNASSV